MSSGMAVKQVNPGADIIGARHALTMNITAARGLQEVLKSNLGPRGTMKMLVSGAGLIKVTKDGKVLLDEMQIQHPTAAIIARTATAQDEMTGDGTTSSVLFTGELLSQAERYLVEGVHPRILVDGFELARERTLAFLDEYKTKLDLAPSSSSSSDSSSSPSPSTVSVKVSRELMQQAARSSLKTKLNEELAEHMVPIIVNSLETICKSDGDGMKDIDLHMVEIMSMKHQSAFDTRFVDGLVLDHGSRHPDMSKRSENAYILILNVSLEYEKSEINAGFFYKDADERQRLMNAERKFTDDKVNKIIAFKNSVCGSDGSKSFIIVNQKGIDPISLDMLQKANIVGIRRAKRRNMERLSRACGGFAVNSVDDMTAESLGFAKLVYEHTLGDDKFTFIEGCKNASSCTILVKGPNDHTIRQIMDAVHDGLRAVKNVIDDRAYVPGAGAFELAAHLDLHKFKQTVAGRAKLGVAAFADALLVIPKTLATNAGLDPQSVLIELLEEASTGLRVGLDLDTGDRKSVV